MTNEKDREEHSAAYNHAAVFYRRLVAAQNALIAYPSVVTRLVRGYGVDVNEKQIDAWLRDALGESAEAEIRDHDARIRTEAYREGFLDGASPDGTYVETERDRLLVAEAVKEERDRLDYALHALRIVLDALKRRRSGFPLDHEHEIATEEFADRILSDDQEPADDPR